MAFEGDRNWLGVAELAIAIVGVILAVVFYRKSKHKIQLSYVIQQTQLLGASRGALPEEVSILYQGNKITNLVKANCVIWNSGNDAIRHQDIVPGSSISLSFADKINLLKEAILKSSLPQNNVVIDGLTGGKNSIEIDFLYLEPRHGFNIELLYNGEVCDPTISGTVIGMPMGFRRFNPMFQENTEGNHPFFIYCYLWSYSGNCIFSRGETSVRCYWFIGSGSKNFTATYFLCRTWYDFWVVYRNLGNQNSF